MVWGDQEKQKTFFDLLDQLIHNAQHYHDTLCVPPGCPPRDGPELARFDAQDFGRADNVWINAIGAVEMPAAIACNVTSTGDERHLNFAIVRHRFLTRLICLRDVHNMLQLGDANDCVFEHRDALASARH
jgi:hypothetical protein